MENENENVSVRKRSKGLVIGLIAAAVIIIAAVVLYMFQPWVVNNVATVDKLDVAKYEYAFFTKFSMSQFLSSLGSQSTPDKYAWNTKVGNETAKDSVKKITLEQIQELKIQMSKAQEAGLKLTAEDLKNVDAGIDQQISQSGSRNAAEEATKQMYGVSLSELKEISKNLTLAQKYRDSITSKITISDDDVKKYYDEHQVEFDKVSVTHILISTVDSATQAPVSAGKKAEAKKKAEELLAKVRAGEDIKALAEKNSEDPGVTQNKGEYTFGKGEMVPEFEEWAFAADRKAGDADIVETKFGYHVMQFHKRAVTPFDEAKTNLKTTLLSQEQSKQFTKKIDEFKKEAKYKVKTNESVIAKIDKVLYGA